MVSQSISVFFLLKNQEAFFRNEGRPLEPIPAAQTFSQKGSWWSSRAEMADWTNADLHEKEQKRKMVTSFALFFFQIEVEDVWTVRQRATRFREKIASSSPMHRRGCRNEKIRKVHLRGLLDAWRRAFLHHVILTGTDGTQARKGGELESCFSTRNHSHREKLFVWNYWRLES